MNFLKTKHLIKYLFFGILFCINILFVLAENIESENKTNKLKYIFSLDTSYTVMALQYSGFGLGINYEHKLTDFLSIRLGYGQIVCFSNVTIVTIDQQLFLNYYPLNDGLDKFYISLGHGGNLFIYPNRDDLSVDAALSMTLILGWKWKILKYLMIDPFIGWNYNILLTNNYENFNSYLNNGLQLGMKLKILFK